MEILKKALLEIKPSLEYQKEVLLKTKNILDKINSNLKDAKAVLGGSGAKGTWIMTFDADIFVKFDYEKYKDKSEKLSDILEKCLKKSFNEFDRVHGSRDYFQIKEKNTELIFEIIPILNIKKAKEAKNITDISPLHTEWVLKHKELRDEIRLTKQFAIANNVYGAESFINGFSGYVCEILTIHYGSFINLIKNAAKWKEKTVIDAENHHKKRNIFLILNKSKLESPIIVIDPVQKERNAAAAMSFEKFDIFRDSCKAFIKNPSIEFFRKKEFSKEKIINKNKEEKAVFIKAAPLDGKKDIVGCKLLKAFEFIHKKLTEKEFTIYDFGWNWDNQEEAVYYFILDKKLLSENEIITGPPTEIKGHAEEFKKKHKKAYEEKGILYAKEKREFREPESLIKKIFKSPYIKDKVKEIKLD